MQDIKDGKVRMDFKIEARDGGLYFNGEKIEED
jgi:hypothetical protein